MKAHYLTFLGGVPPRTPRQTVLSLLLALQRPPKELQQQEAQAAYGSVELQLRLGCKGPLCHDPISLVSHLVAIWSDELNQPSKGPQGLVQE